MGAAAADGDPVITFEQADQEVEYGQGWSFYATATNTYQANGPWTASATVTGMTPVVLYSYNQDGTYTTYITILNEQGRPPLAVGDYEVIATVSNVFGTSWSSASGSLTVVPANLGIEARLTSDPAAPGNVIFSARFTGQFIDQVAPAEYGTGPLAPAGTWQLVIKDAQGKTVFDQTVNRAEGGNELATSAYWTDAKPGEIYTPSATFTPTGPAAGNFSVRPGEGIAFTASTLVRPVPTSTATPSTPVALPVGEDDPAGVPLPLWAVVVGGVILAGLAAVVVVLIVRSRGRLRESGRNSAPVTGEVEQ